MLTEKDLLTHDELKTLVDLLIKTKDQQEFTIKYLQEKIRTTKPVVTQKLVQVDFTPLSLTAMLSSLYPTMEKNGNEMKKLRGNIFAYMRKEELLTTCGGKNVDVKEGYGQIVGNGQLVFDHNGDFQRVLELYSGVNKRSTKNYLTLTQLLIEKGLKIPTGRGANIRNPLFKELNNQLERMGVLKTKEYQGRPRLLISEESQKEGWGKVVSGTNYFLFEEGSKMYNTIDYRLQEAYSKSKNVRKYFA